MFLAAPEATSAVLFGGPMLARVLSFVGTLCAQLRMHLGWERLGAAFEARLGGGEILGPLRGALWAKVYVA